MMKLICTAAVIAITGIAASACTSTGGIDFAPDKVIERSDGLRKRPGWVSEGQIVREEGQWMYVQGTAIGEFDDRSDAVLRLAENNARTDIAKAIEAQFDYLFQNVEDGMDMDSRQVRTWSAEASKAHFSGLLPTNRYWEKYVTSTSYGDRVGRMRAFAEVKIRKADFNRAVQDAIARARGQGAISAAAAKEAEAQLERIHSEPVVVLGGSQ